MTPDKIKELEMAVYEMVRRADVPDDLARIICARVRGLGANRIYFIRDRDQIKIGRSENPEKRLGNIRSTSPTATMIGYINATYSSECRVLDHPDIQPFRILNTETDRESECYLATPEVERFAREAIACFGLSLLTGEMHDPMINAMRRKPQNDDDKTPMYGEDPWQQRVEKIAAEVADSPWPWGGDRHPRGSASMFEILSRLISNPHSKQQQGAKIRVAKCLKLAGWERYQERIPREVWIRGGYPSKEWRYRRTRENLDARRAAYAAAQNFWLPGKEME